MEPWQMALGVGLGMLCGGAIIYCIEALMDWIRRRR